jgi:hypothetical protein
VAPRANSAEAGQIEVIGNAALPARRKAALVVEILVTYCRARWWMMRRSDVRDAVSALRHARRPAAAPRDDPTMTGRRLGRAVGRTLRVLPTDSRCLVQALVLTGLLARRGIEGTLVIGVTPGARFEAHAWVEHGGVPLLPTGGRDFQRLVEL